VAFVDERTGLIHWISPPGLIQWRLSLRLAVYNGPPPPLTVYAMEMPVCEFCLIISVLIVSSDVIETFFYRE
jgi:hypothetical protein